MEKRKCRKFDNSANEASKDLVTVKHGACVITPCPRDGPCPLENAGKYCHFVQRLERTSSQRAYKKSKGGPLRGFEDKKFSCVALRKGQQPRGPWPLNGMKFETLKEHHAKRNPEDLEIDYEDQFKFEDELLPYEGDPVSYNSDVTETDAMEEDEEIQEEEPADLGSGWGRILFTPVRRGKQVIMDICWLTKTDGSEGSFDRVVGTQSKNPTLYRQACKSLWGDLWPF